MLPPTVCRGAVALLNFSVDSSAQQFVCCGTSSGAYGFEGHGLADNAGAGELGLSERLFQALDVLLEVVGFAR